MSNEVAATPTGETQPCPESTTTRLIPTEVCERIIDFVAVRRSSVPGYTSALFWGVGVRATLEACSLTCHAWRPRSQLHLMRLMSVRASITGYRSFGDTRALFHRIPLLQNNMEDLGVEGWNLDIPRFHLVPLEIYAALPSISRLALRGGLVYTPTVFFVSMRRFEHLVHLLLQQVTFLSAHDLRRTFECLRNLKHLVFFCPQWLYSKVDHPPCRRPRPHSRIRLETLSLEAQAKWITDTRSIDFLDWLSASGAISKIQELRLWGLTLIDDNIIAAVSRMLYAAQRSARLDTVDIIFGPGVDWTPMHASLAFLPRLNHLHLACPYDAASLSQLTECVSTNLCRPKDMMHSNLYLHFDKYPHHVEPPAECWDRLDSTLRGLRVQRVLVDCRERQCALGETVVWGDWYDVERGNEWLEVVRERFPKVCEDGHLWAKDSHEIWHHIQCA